MGLSIWLCVIYIGQFHFSQNTEGLKIPWPSSMNSPVKDGSVPEVMKTLQMVRQKRNTPSECNNENCCQNPATNGGTRVDKPQGSVEYHYHYYYYCCPNMMNRAHFNPHLAHFVGQNTPFNVYSPNGTMNCMCTAMTGSCSCNAKESPQHVKNVSSRNAGETKKPAQTQNKNDMFGFMMFDDPVGKDFFDFISKNFVKRDNVGKPNECKRTTTNSEFEDPVCKTFFDFLSKNFMRKSEIQTPTQTSAPTQATTQNHPTSANEFDDVKDVFDAFHSDIAKKMGMMMPNF